MHKPSSRFAVILGVVIGVIWLIFLFCPEQWQALTSNKDNKGAYHQPLWTYLTTAFVPFVGGLVALYQYNRGHQQKEDQFERDKLETQFKNVQDQFASPDTKTRAFAALQLGELAQRVLPGKGTEFIADNYPFFIRTGSQFAIALTLESESEVRAAILTALRQLANFSKAPELQRRSTFARSDRELYCGESDGP